MPTIQLHALLKFGEQKYIEDLYHNGTMYFNTIEKFRTEEDGSLRGDEYEGNRWLTNVQDAEISLLEEGKEIPIGKADSLHFRVFGEQLKGNLYCMYAIHPHSLKDGKPSYDRRVLNFGSHFVIIPNGNITTFISRIWDGLDAIGLNLYGGDLVKYYDELEATQLLKTDIFMKRKQYAYQNEFRIFVHKDSCEPFSITIGSLADIATLHETKSIKTIV